jgi:hypothetical protein
MTGGIKRMAEHIRRIEAEEIAPALALVWRVFCAFEAPDYSTEGVEEFRSFIR